ncbi:MAG: hypothetical protein J2P23_10320 [Microlunatus sp.]|nr:hypothetical protein [Microlunatus sp.]
MPPIRTSVGIVTRESDAAASSNQVTSVIPGLPYSPADHELFETIIHPTEAEP